ncbi:thioester domain-containing protein [Nocardiopsis coralliicola]
MSRAALLRRRTVLRARRAAAAPARSRSFLRPVLAALLAGAFAAAAAVAAPAAPASAQGGVSRVEREAVPGAPVVLSNGREVPTALYRLRITDDASAAAYGTALATEPDPSAPYVEGGWDDAAPGTGADRAAGPVTWIVRNAYPENGLDTLARRAGLSELSEAQAIAAAQAAIWHYTDGAEPAPPRSGANDPGVLRLYRHLVDGAEGQDGPLAAPALHLSPERLDGGGPGGPMGPFTVSTTASGPVRVDVRGAQGAALTDADGTALQRVSDGGEFFLRAPDPGAAGVATVYAAVEDAAIEPGRPFVGRDGVAAVAMVTAEAASAPRTDTVKAVWGPDATAPAEAAPTAPPPGTPVAPDAAGPVPSGQPDAAPAPSPSPQPGADEPAALARTGTWLGSLLAAGAVLALAGAAAMALARRRR